MQPSPAHVAVSESNPFKKCEASSIESTRFTQQGNFGERLFSRNTIALVVTDSDRISRFLIEKFVAKQLPAELLEYSMQLDAKQTLVDQVAAAGKEAPVVVRLRRNDFFVLNLPMSKQPMRFRIDKGPERVAYTDKQGYAGVSLPVPDKTSEPAVIVPWTVAKAPSTTEMRRLRPGSPGGVSG